MIVAEPYVPAFARWLSLAALLALLAVMAGAFGAHGLRGVLSPAQLDIYQTAASYQMYHALALVGTSLAGVLLGVRYAWLGRWLHWTNGLFLAGILLFCGSLYGLVLSAWRISPLLTPLGGLCFMLGWAVLVATGWRLAQRLASDAC